MRIDRSEVQRIARLARVHLSEGEKELYTKHLNQLLEHVEKLRELDTTEVPPTYHILDSLVNVLRPDQVRQGLAHEAALQNAPDPAAGGFRVPRIVES